ncbi:MAG: hypothetical protein IT429_22630 [Gemmataceae bacterium]|nr:hypothetical protein [Gemmataceae bacterium]
MVVMYASLLVLLGGASFLIRRRATALEKRYTKVLKEANTLLHGPPKEGNSSRSDPYQSAKRTYQLAILAQKKESLEAAHCKWQLRAEGVGRLLERVRGWKGRKLPYVLGALDTVGVLYALEYAGLGEYANPRQLVELVTTWITG